MGPGLEWYQPATVSASSYSVSHSQNRSGIADCLYPAVVDCMDPLAPTNGTVDTSRGTTYQSVAVYQCDEGYTLQGQSITACLENGTWSGPTPTCVREWPTELGLECLHLTGF